MVCPYAPARARGNNPLHGSCLLLVAHTTIIELPTESVNNLIHLEDNMLTVGVAMLQGARHEHMACSERMKKLGLRVKIRELRKSSDIEGIDAVILPGGRINSNENCK